MSLSAHDLPSFHLNGHITGFCQQTQKLVPLQNFHQSSILAVKVLISSLIPPAELCYLE